MKLIENAHRIQRRDEPARLSILLEPLPGRMISLLKGILVMADSETKAGVSATNGFGMPLSGFKLALLRSLAVETGEPVGKRVSLVFQKAN